MRLLSFIAAVLLPLLALEVAYRGAGLGFLGYRFVGLLSWSALSLLTRTGFPHGDVFLVLGALSVILSCRINVVLSAFIATFLYVAQYCFNKPRIFEHFFFRGTIYEPPSPFAYFSGLSNAEIVYFLALGKFVQFLILITVTWLLTKALYDPNNHEPPAKILKLFGTRDLRTAQDAYHDSKILLANQNRERNK